MGEEWTLLSTANATHPFHIHVVPFMVKETFTMNENPRYEMYTKAASLNDTWRDTVVVPPNGGVKIWLHFSPINSTNLNGKSVFHCHFLAHEDTGMIAQIMFTDPNMDSATTNDWNFACAIDYLCGIFAFHLTEGIIHTDDFDCVSGDCTLIEMTNGFNARVKCDIRGRPYGIEGGGNDKPANFTEVDIVAPNGVIHIIDEVLVYPSVMEGIDSEDHHKKKVKKKKKKKKTKKKKKKKKKKKARATRFCQSA